MIVWATCLVKRITLNLHWLHNRTGSQLNPYNLCYVNVINSNIKSYNIKRVTELVTVDVWFIVYKIGKVQRNKEFHIQNGK